jgi:hypothetical protein
MGFLFICTKGEVAMYKVIDSANNVHWIEANGYRYDNGTLDIVHFHREVPGDVIASFKSPISIELVQEEKKEVKKEIQYVPYPVYPTYWPGTYGGWPIRPNTLEITWVKNGSSSMGPKFY